MQFSLNMELIDQIATEYRAVCRGRGPCGWETRRDRYRRASCRDAARSWGRERWGGANERTVGMKLGKNGQWCGKWKCKKSSSEFSTFAEEKGISLTTMATGLFEGGAQVDYQSSLRFGESQEMASWWRSGDCEAKTVTSNFQSMGSTTDGPPVPKRLESSGQARFFRCPFICMTKNKKKLKVQTANKPCEKTLRIYVIMRLAIFFDNDLGYMI